MCTSLRVTRDSQPCFLESLLCWWVMLQPVFRKQSPSTPHTGPVMLEFSEPLTVRQLCISRVTCTRAACTILLSLEKHSYNLGIYYESWGVPSKSLSDVLNANRHVTQFGWEREYFLIQASKIQPFYLQHFVGSSGLLQHSVQGALHARHRSSPSLSCPTQGAINMQLQ